LATRGATGSPPAARRLTGRDPPREPARSRTPRTAAAIVVVLAAFVVSRLAAVAAGVRFDSRRLGDATQIADPRLLHHHLAETVWWMHGQPPLYNLYIGVVLKAFPGHVRLAFLVTQLAFGVALAVGTYLLLNALHVVSGLAAALAICVIVSPPVLLYEWMLFYDYSTLVLVALTAFFFVRMIDCPTFYRAAAFFATSGALTLTRTIFHPLWLLAQLGLALATTRGASRRVLAAAAVPLALVALVVGKNMVQFGVPGTSSWLGLGVARLVTHDVPRSDIRRLVDEGRVDRVALARPFVSGLASYRSVVAPHAPTGHAILDERRQPSGKPNFFNLDYVAVSRAWLRADVQLVEARPGDVFISVKRAFEYFFQPDSASAAFTSNRRAIHAWDDAFSLVALWSTPYANRVSFLPALLFAVGLIWGLLVLIRAVRAPPTRDERILLHCWLTLVVVGIGGNLAEAGENYRFGFVLYPLLLVVGVIGVRRLLHRTRESSVPVIVPT
jgi:hypothetical protein